MKSRTGPPGALMRKQETVFSEKPPPPTKVHVLARAAQAWTNQSRVHRHVPRILKAS